MFLDSDWTPQAARSPMGLQVLQACRSAVGHVGLRSDISVSDEACRGL